MADYVIVDEPQRSPGWFAARLGRVTGSVAKDICRFNKDGKTESADRRNLRTRLVLERITGRSMDSSFQSAAMLQGIEREPDAAGVYEALTGRFLNTTGFLKHTKLMAGTSLDGHVGDSPEEGIAEIKCPIPATHLYYLRTGEVPSDYMKQVIHALWISGAPWCDWLSYNPDFPEPLRVKLVRVERDDAAIKAWEILVRQFIRECDEEQAEIERMVGAAA